MADGAQANPKGCRKKVPVRHPSGSEPSCFPASSPGRISRSSLGMKKLFAIALLAGSVLPMAQGSMLNLKCMVEAMTGRKAIRAFVGYGCYCGLGGQGLPVDGVDWCCHAHDCCYQKLFDLGCFPYVDPYDYTIENGTIVCSEHQKTECDQQACACDKDLALCFQSQVYHEEYRSYFNIRCQSSRPPCSIYEQHQEEGQWPPGNQLALPHPRPQLLPQQVAPGGPLPWRQCLWTGCRIGQKPGPSNFHSSGRTEDRAWAAAWWRDLGACRPGCLLIGI
ncbi:group IIF secretory phospholipase A2 isoform X2 [Echinops telfairi]|uniref:Group IIF secretory phospholipase A2 isoform X2 n=1 Tax=Echinops telfairi TaxID=9371 RepID=A0AC55DTZ3_ECHTE|nr:group IIF secretory phospholipase A2 isoform X2 [Echinops telfairi]